jgi:opacity protein-like surface antigen
MIPTTLRPLTAVRGSTARRTPLTLAAAGLCLLSALAAAPPVDAGNKWSVGGLYMRPYGDDAEQYSEGNFGLLGYVVLGLPGTSNLLAGEIGFEYVNLLSAHHEDVAYLQGSPLPYDIETDQHFWRLYVGPRIGTQGNGFLRPHGGVGIAMVGYGINTDLVIQGDTGEVRRSQYSEDHIAFGFDISAGLDLNFDNNFSIDGGVKWVKSLSVPATLDHVEATKVHPQYFQIFLSFGMPFGGDPDPPYEDP